jgi:hypothetical protein
MGGEVMTDVIARLAKISEEVFVINEEKERLENQILWVKNRLQNIDRKLPKSAPNWISQDILEIMEEL